VILDLEFEDGLFFLVLENIGARPAHAVARLLPGRVEFGPVVLRRGFAGDPALFQWWNDVVQGNVARRNVGIVLLDEQRQEAARWLIRRAWPSKWVGPDLRGLGNDVAIETLELSHEGIELD
jgi:phage tail-like protein